MPPSFPGRAPFLAACILTILFALAHLGGVAQTVASAASDPRLAAQFQSQREHTFRLLGVDSSLWNLRQYFSLAFSLLLVSLTSSCILAVRLARDPAQAARHLSVLAGLAMLALLALSLCFTVVQGIVTCTLIAGLFFFSVASSRTKPTVVN